jgi:hypothetical protein
MKRIRQKVCEWRSAVALTYDQRPTGGGEQHSEGRAMTITDSNTQTVAAAWASSPLGFPDGDVAGDFTAEPDTGHGPEVRVTRHAVLTGVLAFAIAAGTAVGLMCFDTTPDGPPVVVPGYTSPPPAVVVTPGAQSPTASAPAPSQVAAVPAAAGGSVVINIPADAPTPPDVPAPAEPDVADPQPEPEPQPPVADGDLPIANPEPPAIPDPPVWKPDLPKAPAPQPDPQPDPPNIPDFDLTDKVGP